MSRRVRWWLLLALIIGLIGGRSSLAQLWERYLSGSRGPYRGRVVDAETKKPLGGVVVVAVWQREIPVIIQTNTVLYQAREVLTDEKGEFVLQAEDIEARAPSRTLRPNFVIFLPGYGSFPSFGRVTRDLIGGNFEGPGSDVELPRIKTRKERLENYDSLSPFRLSDDPFNQIPQFMRLINGERVNLGLQPYRPREK